MLRNKYLKLTLSITSLSLLLFWSCDERTPVSSPPPELSYELQLFCNDAECDGVTAYAANNALGEIEITAQLSIDTDEDGVMDGGHQGQEIVFSWIKDDGTPADGFFQISEGYSSSSGTSNIGLTNVNGVVKGVWQDESDLGNFEIKALYTDQYNVSVERTANITLISPESLINSVAGYTSAPNNTLEVPDNSIYTTNINARVLNAQGVNLPNIEVNFTKVSGSGSLSSNTAITAGDGVASVEYQTAPGTSDDIVTFTVNVTGPDDCGDSCTDQFQLTVTSEIYPQEYYVKSFSLESNLFQDNNTDGIKDLLLLDSAPDSTYTVIFEVTTQDSANIGVPNVPVYYRNLSDYGTIVTNMPTYTNDGALEPSLLGVAQAELVINRSDIPLGFGRIEIEGSIHNPDDFDEILVIDDNGTEAIGTIEVDVLTEQYAIIEAIDDLLVSTAQTETFENNNSITYETVITARTIDGFGGLVTDPVMVNFQKLTENIGGYLSATSVLTDSTGKAESTFTVNSADFDTDGAENIDFNIFLAQDSQVSEALTLSYFIEGSQDPELDVSEFHYYPDSDTISHALFEQTSISVIAKNSNGVGISNVLIRFDLDQARNSFGELSTGYEYTCCGDAGSESGTGSETYSCDDGSGCDPAGDPCPDGSSCSADGSSSGSGSGQSGVANVIYTNISEGIDQLRAYILNPNDANEILYEDTIFINSVPNCPDCSEQLTLVSEKYTLPDSFGLESTNIYAFYTDSLGNSPDINDIISFEAIQLDDEGEWVDIGSITPEYSFFEQGDVDDVEDYLPESFDIEGSSIVYAQASFNMENSSGLARIVGTYQGVSDTLGLQINSTEASFVELLPPFPSEIIVQGGGGQESTILTAEIRDGNGNLVNEPYLVQFQVTPPTLDGIHLNGIPGDIDETEISSNGTASITLNSGTKPGSVHVRITVKDHPQNDNYDPDFEIIAESTPVTITTGPPTSAVIGYAFGEAINIGGGLTEMPVSIMLWDAWSNPVSDSTAVYFSLNPPTAAAIIAEAKTGNIKPNSGDEETWPGVAWTTTQYNSAQLFEFPEIIAQTTGNVCINANFNNRADCEDQDMVWLPINSETDGLCSMPTGTNPEVCDSEDYDCEQNGLNCDTEAVTGFGFDPDGDGIYWGIALPLTFSSLTNIVTYENVCVDCSLSLVPLSDTQFDFNDCAGGFAPPDFEVELRAQLLDSYNVPVEGALVELIIFDSQGGPTREGGGCTENDPETGLPYVNQQNCLDAGGEWGYGNWIDELAIYGGTAIQTDEDGLKYFNVTFSIDECIQTSQDPEQWTCSSPIIQANLLNPNGGTSEQINITLNNTCAN